MRYLLTALVAMMTAIALGSDLDQVKLAITKSEADFFSGAADLSITNKFEPAWYKTTGQPVGDISKQSANYSWKFQGKKWRFNKSAVDVILYDGDEAYDLSYDHPKSKNPTEVTKHELVPGVLSPLNFGYSLESERWTKVLENGNFKVVPDPGNVHPNFGPIVRLKGTTENGNECEIWFSTEHSVVVRVEVNDNREQQKKSFELIEFEQRGSVTLPIKGENFIRSSKTGELLISQVEKIKWTNVNNIPDSEFTFTPAEGAMVKDDQKLTLSQVHNGREVLRKTIKPTSPEQARHGLITVIGITLLGACLVAFSAKLGLKRRSV